MNDDRLDRIRQDAGLGSNSLSLARALGETLKLKTTGFVIGNNPAEGVGSGRFQLCRRRTPRQAAIVARGIGK